MSVTIGTYNLRSRSFTEDGTDTGDRAWPVRLPEAADYVVRSGASLVALQEVDFFPAPRQSEELADELTTLTGRTWESLHDTSRPGAYVYDTTVITPLQGGDAAHSEQVDPSYSGVRWCTWARFQSEGVDEPFWVIRTHMPTGGAVPSGSLQAMFVECGTVVANRATVLGGNGDRVVIVGDFNHVTYPQAVLTDRGFTDIRSAAPYVDNLGLASFNGFDATMAGRQDGEWIDAIFLSEGWESTGAALVAKFADDITLPLATPVASDHMPLSAQLVQVSTSPTDPDEAPAGDVLAADSQQRVFVGELTTGRYLRDLPVSACSWGTALNAPGRIQATVPVAGLSAAERVDLRVSLEEGRCYLAVSSGEHVIEAGPIGPYQYDAAAGALQVTASGLRSIFEFRTVARASVVRDVMDGTVDDGTSLQRDVLAYENLSRRTIIKRMVQNSLAMPGGDLPIAFSFADEIGTHSRSYEGFKIPSLAREVDEISNSDGGPDVELRPRFVGAGSSDIEWVLLAGSESDPNLHQDGDDWEWDTTAAAGSVGQVSVSSDPSRRTNMAWITGAGQDMALRISVRTNSGDWLRGYPLRESVTSYPQEAEQAVLQGLGEGRLLQGSRPMTTWSLTVEAGDPALGEVRPGDWSALHIPNGHPWLPSGSVRARVAGIDGDVGSPFVRLTFLPILEHR